MVRSSCHHRPSPRGPHASAPSASGRLRDRERPAMDDDQRRAAPMIRTPHLSARRSWWAPATGVCAVAVLQVAGCGQQAQQTPTAVTSTGVAVEHASVVRGRYTWTIVADGQKLRQDFEVLADGDRRIRITQLRGPGPESEGSAA